MTLAVAPTLRVRLDLDRLVLGRRGRHEAGAVTVLDAVARYAGQEPTGRPPAGMCPVVAQWVAGWADSLNHDDRQGLRHYIPALASSWVDQRTEQARRMLAVDHLLRLRPTVWLQATGLSETAAQLARSTPVTSRASALGCWALLQRAIRQVHKVRDDAETTLLTTLRPQDIGYRAAAVSDVLSDVGLALAHHATRWPLGAQTSIDTFGLAALMPPTSQPHAAVGRRQPETTGRGLIIDATCALVWRACADATPLRNGTWVTQPTTVWVGCVQAAWHVLRPVRNAIDRITQETLDHMLALAGRGPTP